MYLLSAHVAHNARTNAIKLTCEYVFMNMYMYDNLSIFNAHMYALSHSPSLSTQSSSLGHSSRHPAGIAVFIESY